MKRLIVFVNIVLAAVALLIVPVTFSSCASAERTSYKATGVTAATADAAIKGWSDYVSQQKALGTPVPLSQERQVAKAWKTYQLALKGVTDAGLAYSRVKGQTNAADVGAAQTALNNAASVLSASISDLVGLIASFGIKVQ